MDTLNISQQRGKLPLLFRFLIYGMLGWGMEIVWTGLGSLLRGDLSLASHTYLWMFPIYGLAVLLEQFHFYISELKWWERGVSWIAAIWSIELVSGFFIKALTGACPWDYSSSPMAAAGGLIRLDYAPAWFVVGLLFEQLHDRLKKFKLTSE